LKSLVVTNSAAEVSDSDELGFDNNQSYSVVDYPHITTLDIMYMHTDYIEPLPNECKTRLSRLIELKSSMMNSNLYQKILYGMQHDSIAAR
jgi:hypothetical protein